VSAVAALYDELRQVREQLEERRTAYGKISDRLDKLRREEDAASKLLYWSSDREEKLIAALKALDAEIPEQPRTIRPHG